MGQPEPPAVQPPAPAPAGEVVTGGEVVAGKKERTEEIVVTGTRIRRKDLNTPAPVTVINREQIAASGKVTIGEFLQALPEQGNAVNTQFNNGGDGSTRISLRGLGSERTLVLINGRRMVPGGEGANASVDLNSIPAQAIERVEILKDGASAVYGSDAIAGVVNLITRKRFEGSEVQAFSGTSNKGDGTQYNLSFSSGTASDRGSLLFSAGYFNQQAIMAGDREWSKVALDFDYNTMSTVPGGSSAIPMGRLALPRTCATPKCTEVFDYYSATGPGGAYTGTAFKVDPTSPVGFSPYRARDSYNFQPVNYLFTPAERVQLFAIGDTRFGDVARGYFEASYVNQQWRLQLAPDPVFTINNGIAISADSIYNPFGIDLGDVRRRLEEFGPRMQEDNLDTFRIVAGLDGTLPEAAGPLSGWFWDVSFNWARNGGTHTVNGELRANYLGQAIGPSMLDPVTNEPICVTTPGDAGTAIPGCVPLNLLGGVGSISSAQKAAIGFTGTDRALNQMTAVQANTSGELFRLLADRPVGLAAGYEYRSLSGAAIANPIAAAGESDGNNYQSTKGSYDVNEAYAELSIPIVSNLPFAQDVEATVAARWFDYSSFGSDTTYKAGAKWRIIPDVTVRGTFSTAFRAPAIPELYGATADSFESATDPCAGGAPGTASYIDPSTPLGIACAAAGPGSLNNQDDRDQLKTKWGGNANLKPETADIFTAGVVWEPTFLKNFSLTADYYWIDLTKAITAIGTSTILNSCYPSEADKAPKFCDQVHRTDVNGRNLIDYIDDRQQNVGKDKTAGVDISGRYTLPTPVGRFGFGLDATWLQYYDRTLADGTVIKGKGNYDLGIYPAWKFNGGVTWGFRGFGAGLNTRVIGSFHECANPSDQSSIGGLCYLEEAAAAKDGRSVQKRAIDPWAATDLFVSYDLGLGRAGKTNLAVGVQNAFDANPPRVYSASSTYAMSDPTAYDYVGRFWYARLVYSY